MTKEAGDQRGATKAIWLVLLREGGRWRPAEVSRALPHEFSGLHVSQALRAMLKAGQVREFEGISGWSTYGVTASCKTPGGVTLAELAEAGLFGLEVDPDHMKIEHK